MGFNTEQRTVEWLKEHMTEFPYALLYMMSGIVFCETRELEAKPIEWEECLEARFFAPDRELHMFEQEGDVTVAEISDDGDGDEEIIRYALDNRFRKPGKTLLVKQYLDYDEDGQAFVTLTRLCGVE